MCQGEILYDPHEGLTPVNVYGPQLLEELMFQLFDAYHARVPNVEFTYHGEYGLGESVQAILSHEANDTRGALGFVGRSTEALNAAIEEHTIVRIPYAALGLGVIYNLCGAENRASCPYIDLQLVLDPLTVAQILDGTITQWNDGRVQLHNPGVTLPSAAIKVVRPPADETYEIFVRQLQAYKEDFSYGATPYRVPDTLAHTRAAVYDTAYSISFSPIVGVIDHLARVAAIKNKHGTPVLPVPATLKACALDTFYAEALDFHLTESDSADCYPLVEELYVIAPATYEGEACTSGVAHASTYFLQWLIDEFGGRAHEHDVVHHNAERAAAERAISVHVEGPLLAMNMSPLYGFELNASFVFDTGVEYDDAGNRLDHKDASHDRLLLLIRNVEALESITCDGSMLLNAHPDLQHIPLSVQVVAFTFAGLCELFILAMWVWVSVNHKRKLIRNSSPPFLHQVLAGAAISVLAIVPLAVQDDDYDFHDSESYDKTHLDVACAAAPILYSLGFVMVYSALWVKTWRLVMIFNNARLRKIKITDFQLMRYQLYMIAVCVILNVVWLFTDRLHWERVPVAREPTTGDVIVSSGLCTVSGDPFVAVAPLLTAVLVLLVGGNILVYRARHIPSEYSESKWIAIAMIMLLEAMVLGLPVIILSSGTPTTAFITKALMIVVTTMGTVALLFLPKVWLAYGWGIEGQSSMWAFKNSSSSGGSGSHMGHTRRTGKTNSRTNVTGGGNSWENVTATRGMVAPGGTAGGLPSLNTLVSVGGGLQRIQSKESGLSTSFNGRPQSSRFTPAVTKSATHAAEQSGGSSAKGTGKGKTSSKSAASARVGTVLSSPNPSFAADALVDSSDRRLQRFNSRDSRDSKSSKETRESFRDAIAAMLPRSPSSMKLSRTGSKSSIGTTSQSRTESLHSLSHLDLETIANTPELYANRYESQGKYLEAVLKHKGCLERLIAACEKEHSDEAVRFYSILDEYQTTGAGLSSVAAKAKRQEVGKKIMEEFILDFAPKQMNLSSATKKELEDVYNAEHNLEFLPETFDAAKQETFYEIQFLPAVSTFLTALGWEQERVEADKAGTSS